MKRPLTMAGVCWVPWPCVSVCVLLSVCVGRGAEALISKHCDTYEEDVYVQPDKVKTLSCHQEPGLGSYTECSGVTDFRSDLKEVFPDTRSLCVDSMSKSLPANTFSHLPSLVMLKVDSDHLVQVTPGAFSGLSKLRILHFYASSTWDCLNANLEKGLFQGLASLEELVLKKVCLSSAPPDLLSPLLGLQSLQVSNAGVTQLGDVFCLLPPGMMDLEKISLQYNNVKDIQYKGCETSSKSDPWPMEILSRIRTLDLTDNPVDYVGTNPLEMFQNLSCFSVSLKTRGLELLSKSGVGRVQKMMLFSHDDATSFSFSLAELCSQVSHHRVESVEVGRVTFTGVTANAMSRCWSGLRELSVSSSTVQDLDLDFWTSAADLQGLTLRLIKLSNASFCAAGGGAVWNLTSLILSHNHLTAISPEQFSCMPFLEKLDLTQNRITSLPPRAFNGIPSLRFLSLADNKLTQLGPHDFEELPALEVLYLEDNKFEAIEEGVFKKQSHLQELTLGRIDIIYEVYLSMLFYSYPPRLRRLVIDAGPGTNLHVNNITAPEVPMVLELRGKELKVHSSTCTNNLFPLVRELTVGDGATFLCLNEFLAPYFPNLESFVYSANPERFFINYSTINQLWKLKRLKLTNLNFNNHTDSSRIFRNLTQLRSLVLINCRFNFLTKSMFMDLLSLRLLRLYSESPLILLEDAFQPLVSLSTLVFDYVDFRCECSNNWLLEWAETSPHVQVVSLQHQLCIWHYQRLNFLSTMERLCQTNVDFLFYSSTAMATVIFLLLAFGYRFLRWPCMLLLFRLRGWVERRLGRRWWKKRRGNRGGIEERVEEEEVRYDAFVSFSSLDEAWVMGQMAPRLERDGEPQIRLCLHNRDFEVGKGIVDNIAESIYSSRRTVCVLSRRYLRSDWCSLEMKMATHRLLSEHSHKLILIFLEHISPFELSAFHRLAKLVRTRTYLDWPEDEMERVTFWERLRRNISERDSDEKHQPHS
ncbi:toll-like receptor 12 [Osmerus eperlanus]|uniref:toll-like receptor 12 n=1 Tax=Osmerus eperlanus TaxID=29151 RepID=UPI002E106ABC